MAQGTKNLTGALIIGTPIIVVVSIFALVLLFITGGSASAACSGGVGTADPDNVPERFEVDLSAAEIGDTIRWSAVKDQQGAVPTLDRDFVVLTVAPPTVVEAEVVIAAPAPAPDAGKGKGGKGRP